MLLQELALAMQDHPGGRQVRASNGWAAERLAASEFPSLCLPDDKRLAYVAAVESSYRSF